MANWPTYNPEEPARAHRSSGMPDWRTLRLLIHPAYTNKLIVSLVIQPKTGHPTLHPQLRGVETPWFPQSHQDELINYALTTALLRAGQVL